MISADREEKNTSTVSPGSAKHLALYLVLGLFVILGSLIPAWIKSSGSTFLFRKVLQNSSVSNSGLNIPHLDGLIDWIKITQVAIPVFIVTTILLTLYMNRKRIWECLKPLGFTLLIAGAVAFISEIILNLVYNLSQQIPAYSEFLGFSGEEAEIVKMITLQTGNIFLFYWGMTAFGILTLGLVLIMVSRVFSKDVA